MYIRNMENEFLKPSDVALRLKVSTRTVVNMILKGKIKALEISGEKRKSYRILSGELDRFIASEYHKKTHIKDD